MSVSIDNPGLTSEVAAFIERLEFRESKEGTVQTLAIGLRGGAEEAAMVGVSPTSIHSADSFGLYGIADREYRALDGRMVRPSPSSNGPLVPPDLQRLFESINGRKPSRDENWELSSQISRLASASPVVEKWASNLDFDALHATLPFAREWGTHSIYYEWLSGPTVDAQAMKRFVVTYPFLSRVAMSGPELFEAAAKEDSVEAGYEAILSYVERIGFECQNVDYAVTKPTPVPRAILDRLKELPVLSVDSYDDSDVHDVVNFLEVATKVAPEAIPSTHLGILRMSAAGRILRSLAEELNPHEAIMESLGFGIEFTDDEVEAVFRNVDFDEPNAHLEQMYRSQTHHLGAYGAILAGRPDMIDDIEADEGDLDFAALRAELLRDGFLVVAQKAKEADDQHFVSHAPSP